MYFWAIFSNGSATLRDKVSLRSQYHEVPVMHMSNYDSIGHLANGCRQTPWKVGDNRARCKLERKKGLGQGQSECRDETKGLIVVSA